MKNTSGKQGLILFLFIIPFIFSIGMTAQLNSHENIRQMTRLGEVENIKSGYIYFGRPSCPSCQIFYPILQLASQRENKQIWYFNTDYFRTKKKLPEYEILPVCNKYKISRVPVLIYVENGKIIDSFGREITNNKEKNDAYKGIMTLMRVSSFWRITWKIYSAPLVLLFSSLIFQFLFWRKDFVNSKMNFILRLYIFTDLGIYTYWYFKFRSVGLNLMKSERFFTIAFLVTIIVSIFSHISNINEMREIRSSKQ